MALPNLPSQGQNPWYIPRTAWDNAVEAELEGRLSEASLITFRGTFITDEQYPNLGAAVAALPVGGTLEIRKDHSTVLPITVNKECTIRFAGGSVQTSTAGQDAFFVTSGGVRFQNPKLRGVGHSVNGVGSGIRATGTVAVPLQGFTVEGADIRDFNYIGILTRLVDKVRITGGEIQFIGYSAITVSSCNDGHVSKMSLHDITMPAGQYVNSYGVAFTNWNSTEPASKDCVAENNYLRNIPWEALDTHGGQNVVFRGNTVRNCGVGVAIVDGPAPVTGGFAPPKNAQVINNDIEDCNYSGGIVFVGSGSGVPTGTSTLYDPATGIIMGNTIRRCGKDSANYGGIVMYNTKGVIVANNIIEEPSVSGIMLNYQNEATVVVNNVITDVHSATIITQGILVNQYFNGAFVAGNTLLSGSKTAVRKNEYGLRLHASAGVTGNGFTVGPNKFTAAVTSPLGDTGNATTLGSLARVQNLGVTGGSVGFWGATPVVRPAAIANATDAASAITQLNLLLAAARTMGLIAP